MGREEGKSGGEEGRKETIHKKDGGILEDPLYQSSDHYQMKEE